MLCIFLKFYRHPPNAIVLAGSPWQTGRLKTMPCLHQPSSLGMFTERQPKRLGTSTSPISDDAHNSYLDTVPDENLRVILRYLSRHPQHHNWRAYISASSVNTALDVGGPRARVAFQNSKALGVKTAFHLILMSTYLFYVHFFTDSLFVDLLSNFFKREY